MGKGTIISDLSNGLYELKLEIDETWINEAIVLIDLHLTQWPGIIAQLTAQIATIQSAMDAIIANQDALDKDSPDYQSNWNNLQQQYNALRRDKQLLETQRSLAITRQTNAQARKDELENYKELYTSDVQVQAWCADLTEGLSGEVATVEVPNERFDYPVQIRPGYSDGAVYDSGRDGFLQHATAVSPSAVFYNLAMLPGKQRWLPQYRYAEILEIDWCGNRKAKLNLEAAVSSQQIINVNPDDTLLLQVDAEYMENNMNCFEVGDIVLVEFTDRDFDQPKIIGFKDNPRTCSLQFWLRPKIDTLSMRYGGQQFSVKYIDDTGTPQEAGPLPVRGGTDTTRHQYCGPFDLSTWDKCNDVEIHLYADKDLDFDDNAGVQDWLDANTDDETIVQNQDIMFDFFEEDPAGEYVFAISTLVFVSNGETDGLWPLGSRDEACVSEDTSEHWHSRIWQWPQMITKINWDAHGEDWYYPWFFGGSPIQNAKQQDRRKETSKFFNKVESIFETFTAAQFISLVSNTEAQVYNWDTSEFVENARMINYNFVKWMLPGIEMERVPFAVNFGSPNFWQYVTDQIAFTFGGGPFGESIWPNFNGIYQTGEFGGNPPIDDPTGPWSFIGPQNEIRLFSHNIYTDVQDHLSLDPDEFLGTRIEKFWFDWFFLISSQRHGLEDGSGLARLEGWDFGISGGTFCVGQRIMYCSGPHTYDKESDWQQWPDILATYATDVFHIIADREDALPNNVAEVSKAFYRNNLSGCQGYEDGGECKYKTVQVEDDNWPFSISNSTLPLLWF